MERTGTGTRQRSDDRNHAQRLDALAQANRVRAERAAIKAALRRGDARAATLLLDPPPCLLTAGVAEILLAAPGIGEVKARRLLLNCRVSPAHKLERISRPQREELVRRLGARGQGR